MSKSEAAKTIQRTVKVFDNDLNLKEATVSVTFVPANSIQDAMARYGDESAVLAALNQGLQTKAVNAEVSKNRPADGISIQTFNKFARQLRNIPPYDSIKDASEQTDRIVADIKSNPFMLGLLRNLAEKDRAAGDESEDQE